MSLLSWIRNIFKKETLSDVFNSRLESHSVELKDELVKPIEPENTLRKDSDPPYKFKYDKILEDVTPSIKQLYSISKTSSRNVYHIIRSIIPGNIYVKSKCGTLIISTKDIFQEIPENRRYCKLCEKLISKKENND